MKCIKKLFLQVVIVVAFASIRSGPVNATFILQVSDFDSNLTLSGPLSASMEFEVSGNHFLIDDNNTSVFSIAQLCFNSDATLKAFGFSGRSNSIWSIPGAGSRQNQNADGFANCNWLIDFGSDINRLSAAVTQLILAMTGTTPGQTIDTELSAVPPGHMQTIAAMKFEARPKDDSTFGARLTRAPEAIFMLLFGLGLVFFAKFVRKGRNRYLRHSRRPEWRTKSQNLGPRASNPADGGVVIPKIHDCRSKEIKVRRPL